MTATEPVTPEATTVVSKPKDVVGPRPELAGPPTTFLQCISQAQTAAKAALKDGFRLLEVEFPPLSAEFLEDSKSSAYDVSGANIRLAIDFARIFSYEGKNVSIMLPDPEELERAVEDEGSSTPEAGISLHSLRTGSLASINSFDQLVGSLFGRSKGTPQTVPGTDVYIAVVFSAQELPDLEWLATNTDKPLVFFNLKLDTQRGDLGLPAFPPKDLHFRFLSQVKPVYLLRTRQYSRSLNRPPYIVNYQGAQFRVYPGDYQSLLDTGSRYRRVQADEVRPALGEFKEIITQALQFNEGKEEGKVATFFRRGYKTQTWWEEQTDKEESNNWRT